MKKTDVKIGATYMTKVAGNVVPVKITNEHDSGGWEGTSVKTGKTIRIKSAQRLRTRLFDAGHVSASESATDAAKSAVATQEAKPSKRRDTGQRGASSAKRDRLSILDAAVKVLGEADGPLACGEMIERMQDKGYWYPPSGGKTPAATLYSAILREIQRKGDDSRFAKIERGKFSMNR